MLNSGFRGKRATDGTGAISAQTQSVQATFPVPKINSYVVTDGNYIAIDDTAASAGATIVVYGNNFVTGMTVYIGNTSVAVTYLDPTRIAFIMPTLSNGTYIIYVITPQGAAALLTPGIIYSGFPTWSTSTYTSIVTTINIQLLATGDAPLTYALQGGSTLPTGITLTSTGLLSGTASSVTADSVFYFTVIVDDAQLQSTQQSITLTFQFGEPYFKNTTLLLNGETTVTPFINDASTNSFGLIIAGDTKPVLFNPYTPGYYSNFFDGTGDYLSVTAAGTQFALSASDFTMEAWVYLTGYNAGSSIGIASTNNSSNAQNGWYFFIAGTASSFTSFGFNAKIGGSFTVQTGVSYAFSLNTWYHLAIVKSVSGYTFYANGVSLGTNSSQPGTWTDQTTTMYIGTIIPSTNLMTGHISNFRLVKGTALYTSTFTPSTTPLTAIANTSLLTCQSSRFIDNSANEFTITVNGDTSISPNIPFTANVSYSTYGSAYFDGTGDYLTTTGTAAGSGNLTYECWFYSTSFAAAQTLFTTRTGNTTDGFQCMLDSGGEFRVGYAGINFINSTISFGKLNRWYHVAVTRSSGTVTLWIDGISIGTAVRADNLTSTAVGIGAGRDSAGNNPVTGYISNLRFIIGTALYTATFTPPTSPLTAITNTSLLTLQYNGGATNQAIIDNGPFNNIITRFGNTSQGSFSPYSVTGWSLNFNRSKVESTLTGKSPGTGSFTYELFFNVTIKEAVINNVAALFSTRGAGSGADGFDVQITTNGSVEIGTSGSILFTSGTGLVTNGVWYHLAIVRNGTTNWTIYLNGSSIGTITNSTNFTSTDFYMGVFGGNINDWFKGYISNFRYTRTAVYTATFTVSASPLTVIANTEYLVCQSNRLVDNSPNNFTVTPVVLNGSSSVQAFGPFGSVTEAVPISYSNYFDGTGDYLTTPSNATLAFGSGDFCLEFWIYTKSFGSTDSRPLGNNTSWAANAWSLHSDHGTANEKYTFWVNNYNSGSAMFTSTSSVILNTWTHVAITRSGTSWRMFINGVQEGSTVTSSAALDGGSSDDMYIGGSGAVNEYVTGYMSNVRVVKGTAVYTSNFTPSTTPLTAIANTSLLTCQSTRMIDNSTNAFAITANGNVVPRIFNPFGYTEQIKTNYTPSTHGGSAYFDGTGDNLTTPNNAFDLTTTTWCIEYWIYPTTIASATYYGLWALSTSGFRQGIYGDSGTHYLAVLNGGGGYGSFNLAAPNKVVVTGAWQHVALTSDGTTIRQFYNGVLTSTGSAASFSASTPTVGSWGGATYFAGYISDFRITKGLAIYPNNFFPSAQAVTNYSVTYPASLLLNFNNGGIVDKHSTNALETVGNAQLSTAVKKYGNASMYFDGTGDYLTSVDNPNLQFSTGDFTVECWIYPTLISGAQRGIVAKGTNTTGWELRIGAQVSGGLDFSYTSTGVTSAVVVALNAWSHVALTRSGTSMKSFLNGVNVGTATVSDNFNQTDVLRIGESRQGSQNFSGYIDDLRITKGFARYTANFTPPSSALLGQ